MDLSIISSLKILIIVLYLRTNLGIRGNIFAETGYIRFKYDTDYSRTTAINTCCVLANLGINGHGVSMAVF